MPPPGLALVRAPLADKPIVAVEEPRRATIKAILTSVASTEHHEGGSELDVDVDVRIKVDTVDFLVERQDDRFALCYTQLFLPRGNLTWPVVRKWTPSTASWATVTQLADSVSHVHQH